MKRDNYNIRVYHSRDWGWLLHLLCNTSRLNQEWWGQFILDKECISQEAKICNKLPQLLWYNQTNLYICLLQAMDIFTTRTVDLYFLICHNLQPSHQQDSWCRQPISFNSNTFSNSMIKIQDSSTCTGTLVTIMEVRLCQAISKIDIHIIIYKYYPSF